MANHQSFTVRANGILAVLMTQVDVFAATGATSMQQNQPVFVPNAVLHPFTAIWDTGATGSCISQAVVDACGLVPTGMTKVHGVGGVHEVETYLVNIGLPNAMLFGDVRVTKGILPGGSGGDLLIGMDIIGAGDFAVTNKGGKTVFTFRCPAKAHLDFVAEHNAEMASAVRKPAKKRQKVGKSWGKRK